MFHQAGSIGCTTGWLGGGLVPAVPWPANHVPGDHIFGGVQFGPTVQALSTVLASRTADAVRALRKGIFSGRGCRAATPYWGEPIGSVNGHKVDFRGAASIPEDVFFFEKKNQKTFTPAPS
jgi:hypothetical protein